MADDREPGGLRVRVAPAGALRDGGGQLVDAPGGSARRRRVSTAGRGAQGTAWASWISREFERRRSGTGRRRAPMARTSSRWRCRSAAVRPSSAKRPVVARAATEATAESAREHLVAQRSPRQRDFEHARVRPDGERRGRALQAQPQRVLLGRLAERLAPGAVQVEARPARAGARAGRASGRSRALRPRRPRTCRSACRSGTRR